MAGVLVHDIFIASAAGEAMQEVDVVAAIAGVGLEGDRYATGRGYYSKSERKVFRHATLIALADIEAANRGAAGARFLPSDTRRNIVVEGISPDELNALIGKIFRVGGAVVRGIERCKPCNRPSILCDKPGFAEAFDNSGGLRVEILQTGKIERGDTVVF